VVILDTNVISELMRPTPDPKVVMRLRGIDASSLFTTTITEAELLYGVESVPDGKRRRLLEVTVWRILKDEFANRILSFDSRAAESYAGVMLLLEKRVNNPDVTDAQIAAIAKSRGFSVATRNVKHFDGSGVDIIDPWAD